MKSIENFVIANHGQYPLLCDLYLTESASAPIIVYCHGYKGFKDWGHLPLMAKHFVENGYNFLKFNFSHNGGTIENPIDFPDLESFSNNNYSIELQDLQNALNWLESKENQHRKFIDLNAIYLMGHSRGGGIAILTAASDKRIKKLVTLSAVCDFARRFPTGQKLDKWKKNGVLYVENFRTKQKMPHKYQFYEDFVTNRNKLDIPNAESKLKVPHLIIHGTQDETVYLGEALHLMSLNDESSLIKIHGGTHTLGAHHPYNEEELPDHIRLAINYSLTFFENQ